MPSPFEHVVVLDFEATCQPGAPPDPQEIIEFPSVLVSLVDDAVIDEFSSFVRPVHHPRLSQFCSELTSIQQPDVDAAEPFLAVLAAHRAWLTNHDLLGPGPPRFAFVTCGDWDLATMLPVQCAASALKINTLPLAYRRWCNIKTVFAAMSTRSKGFGMPTMLRTLGLELEGRHHRGIDDCRNIARIALALHARGATLDVTGRLSASHYPELPLTLHWHDLSATAVLRKRSLPALLGLACGLFHTQVVQAWTADGTILTDDLLLELTDDTTLHVRSAKDPA
jgi:ERI1 exoribonuclease 3